VKKLTKNLQFSQSKMGVLNKLYYRKLGFDEIKLPAKTATQRDKRQKRSLVLVLCVVGARFLLSCRLWAFWLALRGSADSLFRLFCVKRSEELCACAVAGQQRPRSGEIAAP
jgi:hypothetical protein